MINIQQNKVKPSHEIFNQGASYYHAYLKLKDDKQTYNPSYVCLAFAIELFLKSLETTECLERQETYSENIEIYKVLEKPHSWGHDLFKLFDKLSDSTKTSLMRKYSSDIQDFEKDLKVIAEGFVKWRYIFDHEVEVIHLSALQKIGVFMYSFGKEKLQSS